MELMNSLIEQIRKERVVLFLGSGFSLKAGAPSASAICEALKTKLPDEEAKLLKDNRLDCVSNVFEQLQDRNALIQFLKDTFTFSTKDLSNQVALTQIPHFQNIITTNYDTLLEDTYGDDCVVVRSAQDCIDLPKDKVKIYKIHGDFSNTDNLIITKKDYQKYFNEESDNSLWRLIQSFLLTKDVLFIGYSLDDGNLYTILENILKDTNQNKDNIYLISPSLIKSKQNELKGLNVKYIDSRAEDFLPMLIQSLNKNIVKDYRRKWVSTETASKYCDLHHILLTTQVQSTKNRIEIIKPIGESNEVKLQISTRRTDIANAIAHKDFSLFTDVLPSDSPIKDVPALQIPSQDLTKASIEINGITIYEKDDIKAIYVVPLSKKTKIAVRIPAIGFNDMVTIQTYGDGLTTHFTMQTEIYLLNATMLTSNTDDSYYDLNFNITFKDKYKNNAEALKWIGFLIALFSGEKLYWEDREEPVYGKKDTKGVEFFKRREKYYLNVSEIEKLTGKGFKEYANYSEHNFTNSEIILCYLKQIPWIKSTPDGIDYNCLARQYSQHRISQKNEAYCILLPQKNEKDFIVNGKAFHIPFTNVFMQNCSLVSVDENKKNDTAQLSFHNNEKETLFYFSDKPARLEGNTIHLS